MGILSKGLDKTAGRFIQEAVYGIIASESVMLTETGRQLQSRLSLKKIEEIFSRQLIKPGIWSCLQKSILSLASERVKERTLLMLDLSDLINKRYLIIRLAGTRDLISQGKSLRSLWLAYACRLPYEKSIIKIIEGKEVQFHIKHWCLLRKTPAFCPQYLHLPIFFQN